MLNPSIAQSVIDYALSLGANFAELFIEHQQRTSINTLNDSIQSVESGIDFGIGIRLIFGHKVLYGYTNKQDMDELKRIVSELTAKDRRDPLTTLTAFNFIAVNERHPAQIILSNTTATEEKIVYLRAMDTASRAVSNKIHRTRSYCSQREQRIELFNSEGLHTSDHRHYIRIGITAIASEGAEQATGIHNAGGLLGWEINSTLNAQAAGEEASRQALINLQAKPCPSGILPVVIGNGFGGVIFHEACGHLLETTSVAKKSSIFHDKMGEMIASPLVNAVDDGTLANAWGSINIDDEGMKTQRTQLITDGRLTSFMVDRLGAEKTGYERTGSGRRESYRYAPASRMRNTFIEAGNDDLDSMISSIDQGIYAAHMGGGSVSPGTGEFNFSVTEGYYIEKGKIQYPVKAATLISTGEKVLKEISMVGNNLQLATGMCGSVSGSIPTTVGQPTIKVDHILVGGNA